MFGSFERRVEVNKYQNTILTSTITIYFYYYYISFKTNYISNLIDIIIYEIGREYGRTNM